MLKALWNQFQYCIICEKTAVKNSLCKDCYQLLPTRLRACSFCAAPLGDKYLCDCHGQRFVFNKIQCLYEYRAPISNWIQSLKFQEKLPYAKILGQLLVKHIPAGCLIIPVPIHKKRAQKRGFNQVALCCEELSRYGFKVMPDLARRDKITAPQTELPREKRYANVKNAFFVSEGVKEKKILLIDDVFTTGATVNALASACYEAGAREVSVITLAYAS